MKDRVLFFGIKAVMLSVGIVSLSHSVEAGESYGPGYHCDISFHETEGTPCTGTVSCDYDTPSCFETSTLDGESTYMDCEVIHRSTEFDCNSPGLLMSIRNDFHGVNIHSHCFQCIFYRDIDQVPAHEDDEERKEEPFYPWYPGLV